MQVLLILIQVAFAYFKFTLFIWLTNIYLSMSSLLIYNFAPSNRYHKFCSKYVTNNSWSKIVIQKQFV